MRERERKRECVIEREGERGGKERKERRGYTTHQSWLKKLTDPELEQAVCLS
jgi:hypothetical protein